MYRVGAVLTPKLKLIFSHKKSKHHPIFMKILGIVHTYMKNMFITQNWPWQP